MGYKKGWALVLKLGNGLAFELAPTTDSQILELDAIFSD